MRRIFFSWLAPAASGVIFGLGLIVAGMTDPAKVLAFLDLAGNWNPSLALVMLSAIATALLGFRLAMRRPTSLSGQLRQLPTARFIDFKLIGGSLIFGLGWGLAGICPGPAIVLLGTGMAQSLLFVAAMLVGMALFHLWVRVGRER